MKRVLISLSVVSAMIAAAAAAWFVMTAEPEPSTPQESAEEIAAGSDPKKQGLPQSPKLTGVAAKMVGRWEDDYQGGRVLTRKADGSDTMVVHLEGFAKQLYAERLTFFGVWRIEGDTLHVKSVGGEPARQVRLVLSMMGSSKAQKIVRVTQDEMVLQDEDGTTFHWRRVPDDSK